MCAILIQGGKTNKQPCAPGLIWNTEIYSLRRITHTFCKYVLILLGHLEGNFVLLTYSKWPCPWHYEESFSATLHDSLDKSSSLTSLQNIASETPDFKHSPTSLPPTPICLPFTHLAWVSLSVSLTFSWPSETVAQISLLHQPIIIIQISSEITLSLFSRTSSSDSLTGFCCLLGLDQIWHDTLLYDLFLFPCNRSHCVLLNSVMHRGCRCAWKKLGK